MAVGGASTTIVGNLLGCLRASCETPPEFATSDLIVGDSSSSGCAMEEDVSREVFRLASAYGQNAVPLEAVLGVYPTFVARTAPRQRLVALRGLAELVDRGEIGPWALQPFLWSESDETVVVSAALTAASNQSPTDEREESGVLAVVDVIARSPHLDALARARVLAGILHLGDRRVNSEWALIRGAIPREAIGEFCLVRTNFLHASVVDFFLGWLAHVQQTGDGDAFGLVAAALVRMPDWAAGRKVYEVRRRFPTHRNIEAAVEDIGEWTIREYAARLAPTLHAIHASEAPPSLAGEVAAAWGIAISPKSARPTLGNAPSRAGPLMGAAAGVASALPSPPPAANLDDAHVSDPVLCALSAADAAARVATLKWISRALPPGEKLDCPRHRKVIAMLGHDPSLRVRVAAAEAALHLGRAGLLEVLEKMTALYLTSPPRDEETMSLVMLTGLGPIAVHHLTELHDVASGWRRQRLARAIDTILMANPPTEP